MNSNFTKASCVALFLLLGAGTTTDVMAQTATEKVFAKADQMPALLGGNQAVDTYFARALTDVARGQGGVVTLSLVVGKTGQVSQAAITNTYVPQAQRELEANKTLEQAILKAAASMPGWKPGSIGGKPVAVRVAVPVNISAQEAPAEEEYVYDHVEQMPGFPGGEEAMRHYMATHIQYPKDALAQKKEGAMLVNFVVDKTGKLKDFKVVRGLTPSIDAEALRVLATMPTWSPGKQNGRPVAVSYTMPVLFRLPKDEVKK
jgi:TonB family protein